MARLPSNTSPEAPRDDEVLALGYYNDAVIALEVLYEAALESAGAREELHAEADRLLKRAVQWRDMKYASKGGQP
jgi:hypothetical protein